MIHPPFAKPLRLKDIAAIANVDVSTVSLALRNSIKVADETRRRITEIADRLSYRRDPVNFALSARRLRISNAQLNRPAILFLTNRPDMADFNAAPHMPAFFEGVKHQAELMGFACELQLISDSQQRDSHFESQLLAKRVQGIILAAFLPPFRTLQLDWSRFAVVKIDSSFMEPSVTRIGHDQQQIARIAYQKMSGLGYCRIGLAIGKVDEDGSNQLYRRGHRVEQELSGHAVIPPLLFEHSDSLETNTERLKCWARQHRLDGVISNWGSIRTMLENGGWRVPDEMGCSCLCLNAPDPKLAGTVVSNYSVGVKAVEAIALLVKTRQFGVAPDPNCVYIGARWVDGESAVLRNSS